MNNTQAVILAGGLGMRLRPITEKIPKPLVPIAGKPFLHWQLKDLEQQGCNRVLLLVAHFGEQIQKYFGSGSGYGLKISYAYEAAPLGTGGALVGALNQLEEQFLILNGDSFLHAPLAAMVSAFNMSEAQAMISTYDNRVPVSVIENLQIKDNYVTSYKKNAGPAEGYNWVDSGIYILRKSVLRDMSFKSSDKFQLEELWPPLIERRSLRTFPVDERFYDIGTPERLREFSERIHDYFANTF